MKPFEAPANRFPGLLSEAIGAGSPAARLVPFDWGGLAQGAFDVVVFHWPTEFFRPESRRKTLGLLWQALRAKLRHGTRFVWIVHNLAPHDGGSLDSPMTTTLFLRLLDGLMFLSEDSRAQLHARHPETRRTPSLVTAHGVYPDVAAPPASRRIAPETPRLLFFGTIRAYKNPVGLVRAARALDAALPFRLTLAGTLWDGPALAAEIRAAAQDDGRIALDLREAPIPEAELERIVDEHDAVVLPYTNVLNSGVAFHALCRGKPILAPRIGSLPELQRDVGADWVHLFDGAFTSADLSRFLQALPRLDATAPDLSRFGWDRIGAETRAFLMSV